MKFGFNTPFAEQLDFFRQKVNLPTQRWDDITRDEHDRAFIVAGAQKADLLKDLNEAVTKAIRDGTGLPQFRKDFAMIVQKHGWTGWTGEGSQAGFNWRTKVIYQTNMATSYAAGRYRQLTDPEFVKLRPFWRYVHNDSVLHPRPLHQHWGNIRLTLPWNHPFWQTHFPPNGWGCMCRVVPVAGPESGDAITPPDGWDERNDLGRMPGIDSGFDYTSGKSVAGELGGLVEGKLATLPAPIGSALGDSLPQAVASERKQAFAAWVDEVLAAGVSRNLSEIVGVIRQSELDYLAAAGQAAPETAEIAVEDRLLVGKKAVRHQDAGNALTAEEWKSLPESLDTARQSYFDKQQGKLIYVLPAIDDRRSIRLAVALDFVTGRPKRTLNMVRSAFKIDVQALQDRTRYDEVR